MGMLVDGRWRDQWYDTAASGGEFERERAQRRDRVVAPGETDPEGGDAWPAQSGRYHLYVSLACPWAHRVLIMRRLKGLEAHVGVSITSPLMLEQGWSYDTATGSSGDSVNGVDFHHQLYTLDDPHYSGRVTVPALWDKQRGKIVNNESAELVRMFNHAFDSLTGNRLDFYPQALAAEIDRLNARIYATVNNGVYRSGFATEQAVYARHVEALFETLDALDALLEHQRYLAGEYLTEADIRLFTTLVRFDAVYFGHFKCNLRRIADYPHLAAYLRELYQWPGIAQTVDFDHIKRHYYMSHPSINPNRIVPLGPLLGLAQPHGRDHLPGRGIFARAVPAA